jgi:hypothetical protein
VIAQTREAKIARLESLMDGTLPTEEFMNEEYISLMNEHKVLSTYLFLRFAFNSALGQPGAHSSCFLGSGNGPTTF